MKTSSRMKIEELVKSPSCIQQLPKRKIVQERRKIRQLLRSMLPMEEEQRQIKEEQKLFHKRGKAH